MTSAEVWSLVLALSAIVAPLAFAWSLLAWRDRRRADRLHRAARYRPRTTRSD